MNPYTYKRKQVTPQLPAPTTSALGPVAELVRDIVHAPIHSVVAVAFVMFAAAAALGITVNANAEIASLNLDAQSEVVRYVLANNHGQVLGEQVAAAGEDLSIATYSINAMPMDFDSEAKAWSYGIEVQFPEQLLANGVLLMGKTELAKDLKGSASVTTKAVFKPGARIEINLANKGKKGMERVAMVAVLVPPSPDAGLENISGMPKENEMQKEKPEQERPEKEREGARPPKGGQPGQKPATGTPPTFFQQPR